MNKTVNLTNRGYFQNFSAFIRPAIHWDILPPKPSANEFRIVPISLHWARLRRGYLRALLCDSRLRFDLVLFREIQNVYCPFPTINDLTFGFCGVCTHGGRQHISVMLRWGTGRGVQEGPPLL